MQSLADVQSVASGTLSGSDSVTTLPPDVKEALAMEIKKFKQREKIIRDFKVCQFCLIAFSTIK